MTDDLTAGALDAVNFAGWAGLVHYAIQQDQCHRRFCADTGRNYAAPGEREELATTEALQQYLADFTRWVTTTLWGEDDITPSIQRVLNELPVASTTTAGVPLRNIRNRSNDGDQPE